MCAWISRREFVSGMGLAVAGCGFAQSGPSADASKPASADLSKSPFRIAVINDEISQDFGRACEVASGFGMKWIELRGMWKKNVLALDSPEIAECLRLLKKYELRVTDIASPLFKVDWPGAPKSKFSPKQDQFNANFGFDQQDEVLEKSVELAKTFGTDRVRCFDFWRLDDAKPYRRVIDEKLREAAEKAGKKKVILLLENESACNTATGAEAAQVLAVVDSPWFMLNWDPGNAAAAGEEAYPGGYAGLPKKRIGHCHCKDVVRSNGKYEWTAMGKGLVDWVGQFKALNSDGYRYAVSLETHWRGAGSAEDSTVVSWAGMKEALRKASAL
jgi:sugar phosphate isomerase/epimerase